MTFTNRTALLRAMMLGASALTMTTAIAVPAGAQTITASISGRVRDAAGAPVAGAVIVARNEGTNQTVTTTSGGDGSYRLSGLRPAPYTITTTIGGTAVSERVTPEIGQSATLDLSPAATATATATAGADSSGAEIVVTGRRLVETRTSEVATNVSQQQLRRLRPKLQS
jgi:hypothetical protein